MSYDGAIFAFELAQTAAEVQEVLDNIVEEFNNQD